MREVSLLRIAISGALVAIVAVASANCGAQSYTTCTGLCENALPSCANTVPDPSAIEPSTPYQECLVFCTAIEKRCESVGRQAVFQNYIACATDAGFSCTETGGSTPTDSPLRFLVQILDIGVDAGDAQASDASVPIANAPCGIEQAELLQCEAPDADATLDIPDGAYEPGRDCPDSGGCVECCKAAYPMGAMQFAEAVSACVCGDAGKCQSVCAESACQRVRDGRMPPQPDTGEGGTEAGNACDQCLTAVLDEQNLDAGACVKPVTDQCNKQEECALYANCVSQSGCTN
jgi:hypothetical protein